MTEKIGLVLEGGGMRGVYTGGVLEHFLRKSLFFPYVIGVSAGACNAVSYLSRQSGRNRKVTIDYVNHPDYLSWRNWFRTGSVFGMEMIFQRIPNELVPLDYETLFSIQETFVIAATDPATGNASYYYNQSWTKNRDAFVTILKASSSLPFFAPPVDIDGAPMFDGGVADPIPAGKALEDGCERIVVVLTKDASYRIKAFRQRKLARLVYRRFPKLVEAMERRERVYNDSLALIAKLEEEGRAFVIRPSVLLPVNRMEKNKAMLHRLYELGEEDAARAAPELARWLHSGYSSGGAIRLK